MTRAFGPVPHVERRPTAPPASPAPAAKPADPIRSIMSRKLADFGRALAELQRSIPAKPNRFRALGDNLIAIHNACRGAGIDPRLQRTPAGLNETNLPDGGFLIQPNFAAAIVALAYEEAVIAPLCDRRPTSFPGVDVKIPAVDETSRADGSRWGGVVGYWAKEADAVTNTFPKFRQIQFSASKLIVVATGTDELMSDSALFGATMARIASAEIAFKLDAAIFSGDGFGKPLGVLKSPALITVAAQAGQASGTIVADNISDMWRRLPAPSRKRAVWLVHEHVEQALDNALLPVTMYQPAGTNGSPYPLLKGRPLIAIEQANQLGTVGDIVLIDPDFYTLIDGGLRPALSAHVRFNADEIVWRFVLRVDGKGTWATPITPYSGSTTRSPFVTLAAR